jgi:hypothetical protein
MGKTGSVRLETVLLKILTQQIQLARLPRQERGKLKTLSCFFFVVFFERNTNKTQ